ncbi:MAG: hypothetical protein ACK56F_13780 [bacterium]
MSMPCNHYFHCDCLHNWLTKVSFVFY